MMTLPSTTEMYRALVERETRAFASSQRFAHGLYSGGTFCIEAQLLWSALGLVVRSNAPLASTAADDVERGDAHRAIDYGADEYTIGRPHPMIDPELRNEHVARAMADRAVGALLVDVVLGFGSHRDPAGVLLKTKLSKPVVASVTGTDDDPQSRALQVARLRDAGVTVAPSNAHAAEWAAALVH